MHCIFRPAQPSDAEQIKNLYLELVQDPNIDVDPNSIQSLAEDKNNILIVGEHSGKLVATAFMTICPDVMYRDQPFAIIENIVVKESERGNGIGKALMAQLNQNARDRRCTKIMLLSSSKRPDAHIFFNRCGYDGATKVGFVNYINR